MFRNLSIALTAILLTGTVFQASADNLPKEVDVHARLLFTPVGFDDNDDVMVVLDGYLPDPCHRLTKPFVSVDAATKQIVVGPRAKQFKDVCIDVTVPYTQEVNLGQLPGGSYTIVTRDGKISERLDVQRSSTTAPDDYLYAPVDEARLVYPKEGRWMAVLEGRFTNTCLAIEETKVSLTGKTLQVLPIMKLQTEQQAGNPCRNEETPFTIEVELPYLSAEGRYLLHVRSLNGQSVNQVFYRTPKNP